MLSEQLLLEYVELSADITWVSDTASKKKEIFRSYRQIMNEK